MGGHDRDQWHVGTSPQEGPGGQGIGDGAGNDQEPTAANDQPVFANDAGVPDADAEGPIDDLSAMQADDALLDALGGTDPDLSGELGDQELTALLLTWRQEADSEPMANLVDTNTAMAVLTQAKARSSRRRHRFLVPVATAAAVLSIAFTGVGLAAKSAQPGDALWGLTKVLYADHATSVEAAGTVHADLEEARKALAAQDFKRAWELLERAQQKLNSVQNEDGKGDLRDLHEQLTKEIAVQAPNLPGVPPLAPSLPSVPGVPPSSGSTDPGSPPPDSGSDVIPGPGGPEDPGTTDPTAPTAPDVPSNPPDETTTPPDDSTSTNPSAPPTPTSGNSDEPSSNTPFESAPPPIDGSGGI